MQCPDYHLQKCCKKSTVLQKVPTAKINQIDGHVLGNQEAKCCSVKNTMVKAVFCCQEDHREISCSDTGAYGPAQASAA